MAAISAMTRSNENPDSEGLAGGPAADQGVRPTLGYLRRANAGSGTGAGGGVAASSSSSMAGIPTWALVAAAVFGFLMLSGE